MTWHREDDDALDGPQGRRLGPHGCLLRSAGLAHCSKNRTNGFIAETSVPLLLFIAWASDNQNLPNALVEEGVWEPCAGGYRHADYLKYHRSAEEIERVSEQRREFGRRGGEKKAANRAGKPVSQQVADDDQTASELPTEALADPKPTDDNDMASEPPRTHAHTPTHEHEQIHGESPPEGTSQTSPAPTAVEIGRLVELRPNAPEVLVVDAGLIPASGDTSTTEKKVSGTHELVALWIHEERGAPGRPAPDDRDIGRMGREIKRLREKGWTPPQIADGIRALVLKGKAIPMLEALCREASTPIQNIIAANRATRPPSAAERRVIEREAFLARQRARRDGEVA
jgi:hypothetical protein